MTLEELYDSCGGDYDRAKKILRNDKMIDRFIRKLAKDPSMERLMAAYEAGDGKGIFDGAHSIKGVAANLGLSELSEAAAYLAEAFRPGSARPLADEELRAAIESVRALHERVLAQVALYEAEG